MSLVLSAFLIYLFSGIAAVTIIDIAGSILSRRMNFNYGYFTVFTIFVYTYIPYQLMNKTGSYSITALCFLLIGFYEGIAGWKYFRRLNPYMGKYHEDILARLTMPLTIFTAVITSIICGSIGIFLATR